MKWPVYPTYTDEGVSWLDTYPAAWTARPLKLLATMRNGDSITSEAIQESGEYAVYGGNGLRGYTSAYTHQGERVLIGRQGALCGNIHLVSGKYWASEHAILTTPARDISPGWLAYVLGIMNLGQYSQAAAQPGLAADVIGNLRIPTPSMAEQQGIANFLDHETAKIDALVGKQKKLIATLREDRAATITHAVTKGLDPNVKKKESGVEWLGGIPSHWSLMKLRHIGQPIIGLTYSPEDVVDESADSTLVLRSANIQGGVLDLSDCVYVSSPIPAHLRISEGDILLCSRNGSRALIGKNILIDKRVSGQSFGAFMTIFRSTYNPFLYWVFNSRLFEFQTATFLSSTINQLTTGNLKGMEVPFPPYDEQREIVTFLLARMKAIDALIAKAQDVIDKLQEFRSALITDAVTGKIDVRGAA
ncbi:restriction endonuclease subunit S [Mycolicibacterium gilvum]|uniref:restriction endonuclease subunit S n=1 Tax=Mycolicibacterium gilvum TaxID=1804 RepID=UPI004045E20C